MLENPKEKSCRHELYHLAVLMIQTLLRPQTPQTPQAVRRSFAPRKETFPVPEVQWPIEASIMLEDQALFEMAIAFPTLLSLSSFLSIGKAMSLFDLPTTHAKYVSDYVSHFSEFFGLQQVDDF